MSKTPAIYLADLRHNYSGVLANDCMPLGVGYMKAVMDRDLPEVALAPVRLSRPAAGRARRTSRPTC